MRGLYRMKECSCTEAKFKIRQEQKTFANVSNIFSFRNLFFQTVSSPGMTISNYSIEFYKKKNQRNTNALSSN